MPDAKSADVPTMDEFNALQAQVTELDTRVTALEGGSTTPTPEPPNPNPEPTPPSGDGVQAKRAVELVEKFGVNTFSSLDSSNIWGSWPADYSPPSVIKALRWLVGDSGYQLMIREYHYAGRYDMQKQWFDAILAEFPDTRITLCPGANAGAGDAESMARLPHTWLEGLNEPNTDFGSGEVPYATTMDIQNAAWAKRTNNNVMGPSIVAGTPHPEGWIKGYCGDDAGLAALNAKLDYGNGHYYPPGSPDVPSTGYSVNEYIGGLWSVYGEKPIFLTEYCSLLYNSQGHKDPDTEGVRSAYYTLTTLFRIAQDGTLGLWWYALFDYGTVYKCGLFPTNEQNPRKDAYAVRSLCHICGDGGDDRRTFAPGKLAYSVSGGDDATSHALYQASDGDYFITLWRSTADPGGEPISVTLDFPNKPGTISEYNLMNHLDNTDYTAVQTNTNGDGKLTVQLDGSARVIVVIP